MEPVRNSPEQIHSFKDKIAEKWKVALPKIKEVFKKALIALLGVALFLINPAVFAIGFLCGIIWDKKVQEVAEKVTAVWQNRTWESVVGVGIASILCVQVTWAAASIGYSAYLGSYVVNQALGDNSQKPLVNDVD